MENIVSIILGLLIAWVILTFTSSRRSNYLEHLILHPAPIDGPSMENPALIGAGLASRAPVPVRPSVMDATPASSAQPVMMGDVNMAPISVMPMQQAPPMMPTPMAPPMMPTPMAMPSPMAPPMMPSPIAMPMQQTPAMMPTPAAMIV